MTVIPDTPFDADGWGEAMTEMIWLRKKVRSLELALVGDTNDLNAGAVDVNQDTATDGGFSLSGITNIINNVVNTSPSTRAYGFSVIDGAAAQTVAVGATDKLTFNTVLWDTDIAYSLTSSIFTIPANGIWLVIAHARASSIDAVVAGTLILRTTARDYTSGYSDVRGPPPSTLASAQTAVAIEPLVAGQQMSALWTNGNTGAAIHTLSEKSMSAFRIVAT